MPKFLVTNGSNFQPFTYDELVRPLQEMAQAHRDTQDQYDALSMQTEALRRYISDNEGDAEAKALYDNYVNQLSALQDNLWNNGYTPATRRNLSLARNGYFSDIQRIGKAIQTRQESSLKWRDAVKNDPSLITSGDPGLDGLDAYLHDDLHGSDWYSYSGNKFTAEVGADAKERAKELFGSLQEQLQVTKDPRMRGYLFYQLNQGVTSQQVATAGALVKDAVKNEQMDVSFDNTTPEGILANVLMNHLNSTNAYNNVSPEEFDRLVDDGIKGLSGAIGEGKPQMAQDLEWIYSHKSSGAGGGSGSGGRSNSGRNNNNPKDGPGYNVEYLATFRQDKNAKNISEQINNEIVKPFGDNGIILKDGSIINTPQDASAILDTFGRSDIIERFGGIDPESITTKGGTMPLEGNSNVRVRIQSVSKTGREDPRSEFYPYRFMYKDPYGGDWKEEPTLTKEFNEAIEDYNDKKKQWEKDNPGVNINKLAFTRKEKKKMLSAVGVGDIDSVSDSDAPYVASTLAGIGNQIGIPIATSDMGVSLQIYTDELIDALSRQKSENWKPTKGDPLGVYEVKNGEIGTQHKGFNDLFGNPKKDGLNDYISKQNKKITSVFMYPEDILENRVRFVLGGKVYVTDPAKFGQSLAAEIDDIRDDMRYIMTPLINPVAALNMSDEEAGRWNLFTDMYLGDYIRLNGNMPNRFTGQEQEYHYFPEDIVRSEVLRDMLRNAIVKYMQHPIARAREAQAQNRMATSSMTGANPAGYNDYLYTPIK